MKMKKLLSIGALALTITTCTSMSAFAAETAGSTSRNQAAKEIAMNAYVGRKVVNKLDITVNTPVKNYAKQSLLDEGVECVNTGISDHKVRVQVTNTIQDGYNKGYGFKKIFDSLVTINDSGVDITTDDTFNAAKTAMENMLAEFKNAYYNGKLDDVINKYFKVEALNGKLTYGKNSNNRLVVTLERNGQVILQVSSEHVYSLEKEIRENIKSWADLNEYFNKIK